MELSRDINAHIEENQRASDEMQKASNEAMSPLMDKVEKAIEQLAKERGLALILEVSRGGVAYFDNALDITAEITKAIDK
jgi:Skp family chaperone for outer membrane proteins